MTVQLPDTLPQRIYLLALDPDRGKPRMGVHLNELVRAAALSDLYLAGHLADEKGRAVVAVRHPCHDPVLETVLEELSAARRHKWQYWVGRRGRQTAAAVRDQLADGGWVRVEKHKILGLFPSHRITPRDPRLHGRLRHRVTAALRDPLPRIDPADAALVSLAEAGKLRNVLDRGARRTHKRRLADLNERTGPLPKALKKAIAAQDAAAAG
ncbi:GOLPH3/VPS74 family protein [Actinocorallia populi]|uniref:GOLPH3/VPS74 family protein n=1 Tax=Actinocorallia populi TaxID=2079200 RepID=UPI000D090C73|nr:GPP34 family phosphoprotein [Actinocorallia populi]